MFPPLLSHDCWRSCRIDPRADARLIHLQNRTNPAKVIAREVSDWVTDISALRQFRVGANMLGLSQCPAFRQTTHRQLLSHLQNVGLSDRRLHDIITNVLSLVQ